MTDVLSVTGLRKSFGDVEVIRGLNFSVEEGSVFGFVGANGAGKTTTMKMALGLLEIDSGEITICGEKALYGKTAASVGYLPDVPEFYNYMRPMEFLSLCGEVSGMAKSEIKKRGRELLELVGLSKSNRKIGGFSRGMKQRLGVAQALLNQPRLLICDEPTSALDPMGRKEILDIISAIKGKTTVIFSTHILSDVERVCDRVAVLHGGKIALSGTLSEVKKRQTDVYEIEFAYEADVEAFEATFTHRAEVNPLNRTVTVKNASGRELIEALTEQKLTPLRFELLEPTLEDLYLEVVK